MSNYKRLFIKNACVFLTIATHNRNKILIENIELLRESFSKAKKNYKFEIIAISIMPEHLHMILKPENIDDYPRIIFAIKYHFSRNITLLVGKGAHPTISLSKINKREKGIWQRRYFEHTIINEQELNNHIDYIHYNPVKHGCVTMVKDWGHSSFYNFVKQGNYDINWGSSVDHIKDMNLA